MKGKTPIRLIVLDIDGVLSEGEAAPFDLGLLGLLTALNRGKRAGVTVCTGRPAAYVEALLQAIDCRLPAVFEGGAGVYLPAAYSFLPHPDLGDLHVLRETRSLLEAAALRSRRFFLQPGKDYSISVFAAEPAQKPCLIDWVREETGPLFRDLEMAYSASCLNIQPKGSDKGAGIELLSKLMNIPLSGILGIGDSAVDIPFLSKVGFPAAPENASADVKKLCAYVSPKRTAEGVRDILRQYSLL